MVMARKEVLVQLDDGLVAQLDALAHALSINRSELIRRATKALIDAEVVAKADQELQEAYRRQPQDRRRAKVGLEMTQATLNEW